MKTRLLAFLCLAGAAATAGAAMREYLSLPHDVGATRTPTSGPSVDVACASACSHSAECVGFVWNGEKHIPCTLLSALRGRVLDAGGPRARLYLTARLEGLRLVYLGRLLLWGEARDTCRSVGGALPGLAHVSPWLLSFGRRIFFGVRQESGLYFDQDHNPIAVSDLTFAVQRSGNDSFCAVMTKDGIIERRCGRLLAHAVAVCVLR